MFENYNINDIYFGEVSKTKHVMGIENLGGALSISSPDEAKIIKMPLVKSYADGKVIYRDLYNPNIVINPPLVTPTKSMPLLNKDNTLYEVIDAQPLKNILYTGTVVGFVPYYEYKELSVTPGPDSNCNYKTYLIKDGETYIDLMHPYLVINPEYATRDSVVFSRDHKRYIIKEGTLAKVTDNKKKTVTRFPFKKLILK